MMGWYPYPHEEDDELYSGFTYSGESDEVSLSALSLSFNASTYPPPPPHHHHHYDPFFFGFNISDFSFPQLPLYAGHQDQHQYQYSGFSPETKPLFHPATGEQSWSSEGSELEGGMVAVERSRKVGVGVGRYSVEERRDRIMRYLKKKNQRNFNKTIKYVCRKTLADRRVRVRGRFARNSNASHQPSPISNNHHLFSASDDYLLHMENDQGWLHEALPHFISYPNGDDPLNTST